MVSLIQRNSCKTIVEHAAVYEILKREKADGTYESAMPSCSLLFLQWLYSMVAVRKKLFFFIYFSQEKDSLFFIQPTNTEMLDGWNQGQQELGLL